MLGLFGQEISSWLCGSRWTSSGLKEKEETERFLFFVVCNCRGLPQCLLL